MIRNYGPILLIPAAWVLTYATMLNPGVDPYWIQHMHYFMLVFLSVFTVLSWNEMKEDPVLDIWKYVIAAGMFFTFLGALSFIFDSYSFAMALSSLSYWFVAPGTALYLSSREMDSYSDLYEYLSVGSIVAFGLFVAGFALLDQLSEPVLALSIALIAVTQTLSIIVAAKLDGNPK